jgi:hypothetical protein
VESTRRARDYRSKIVYSSSLFFSFVWTNLGLSGPRGVCFGGCIPNLFVPLGNIGFCPEWYNFCFRHRRRKREDFPIAAYPPTRLAGGYVADQRGRRDPMNHGPVLQHESDATIGVNDLLRRPAIRWETCLHRLYILRRVPLPVFRVEMCWLSVLCRDVDHRSQLAETIAVDWATDSLGGLDLRFEYKVGSSSVGKQMHCLAGMVSSIDRAAALECSEPTGKSPGFGPECVAGRLRPSR